MAKDIGFYFNPKQWLGDHAILAMDWDCKAMHLHLMCIASQQEKKGYLVNDDKLIKKYLHITNETEWVNRIKPQILSAWKQIIIDVDGVKISYLLLEGLTKNNDLISNHSEVIIESKRKKLTKKELSRIQDFGPGFEIKNLLKDNLIMVDETNEKKELQKQHKETIWNLGLKLLVHNGCDEVQARRFTAKLISNYGEQNVAQAISQLSIKFIAPVEAQSYLIGILRKVEKEGFKKTGRGKVSL